MRLRFFLIIAGVLLLTTIGVSSTHFLYTKNERLKRIDQLLRANAVVLVNSELGQLKKVKFEEAEKIISAELGEGRINKFFVMKNARGEVLYSSQNFDLLKIKFEDTLQWITFHDSERFVRVLNLGLPSWPDRFLQIGIILDPHFLSWGILNKHVIGYITAVVFVLLGVSVVLGFVLLAPVRQLSEYVGSITQALKSTKTVPAMPTSLSKWQSPQKSQADEFSMLLAGIDRLVERINLNSRLTRTWTSQMAHEFKTPLALIRAEIESVSAERPFGQTASENIKAEVTKLSETMTQFLAWAEVEHSDRPTAIYAIKVAPVVQDFGVRIGRLFPNRLSVNIENDILVLANPQHFEQVISNLVFNAMKYSPEHSPVSLTIKDQFLVIEDRGPGIPADVLEKFGQPYNVGRHSGSTPRGSGLGLAWTASVARIYDWTIDISSSNSGTKLCLQFPKIEAGT